MTLVPRMEKSLSNNANGNTCGIEETEFYNVADSYEKKCCQGEGNRRLNHRKMLI